MMNKANLAREVRRHAGITCRAAADSVDAFINSIAETLAEGGSIELRGLGTFTVKNSTRRQYSLKTGTQDVPAHRRVVFRPSEKLRRAVWSPSPKKQST